MTRASLFGRGRSMRGGARRSRARPRWGSGAGMTETDSETGAAQGGDERTGGAGGGDEWAFMAATRVV